MTYEVIFDVSRPAYTVTDFSTAGGSRSGPSFGATTVVLLAIAAVTIAARNRLGGLRSALGLGVILVVWILASVWLEPTLLIRPRTVAAKVVTGVVRDFVPMPATGHADEQFCVQDACFHYSDYEVTGGFNNTSSHGGPIREGLPVRITYVEYPRERGNKIVKLEIER